jgi:hypothetical protein
MATDRKRDTAALSVRLISSTSKRSAGRTVEHKTKQFDAPYARFADTPADDDSGEAGDE